MGKYKVEFFRSRSGASPIEEFLDSLDRKTKAKTAKLIDMLEYRGGELREPYSKHLNDGIFELRVQSGSDVTRVLYFFFIGKRVVLTNGFIKKTRRTPREEIERARRYREEFLIMEEKYGEKQKF